MDEKAARRLAALQADIARYRRPDVPPAIAFHPGDPQPRELPAGPFTPPPMPTPDECLARIAAHDGAIRAFVQVDLRPAAGIPIAVKDVYDLAGQPTTAGSRLRQGHVAGQDAAVVARLRRAGAVIIGKTATHEFAYGTTTDSPFHGPVHNPLDRERTPGGSSGGSAAAVAAGMVPIALGTDTAGSVRIPAACCGVVGLKPTYGTVSATGIVPLSWTLDHPGPIGRRVGHVALALALMTDFQPAGTPATLAGVRVGVPAAWLETPLEPEVRSAFQSTIDQLQMLRAQVQLVELPALERFHFVSRLITLAEAAAYHAPNLDRLADYAPDVAARVELGQQVLARDYLLAQQIRTELCRETAEAMAGVDFLVTPTLPIPAPLIGQRVWTYPDGQKEPVAEALTRFVAPFNVTGQPAISLPPGVQLVAPVGADGFLLQVAGALERRLNEITPPA